jgi:hypothetical protein
MQRVPSIFILAIMLAACAGPLATSVPTPVSDQRPTTDPSTLRQAQEGPTLRPTNLPPTAAPPTAIEPPTRIPTLRPTSLPPTAAQPTSVPPTSVPPATLLPATLLPAATKPPAPTSVAATPLPDAPLDPQAQVRALLPEFAGDLGRAGEWNRYTISAAIDPQARTIAGHERVEYTNRDTVTLDRLYFHLYPNLRDFAGSLLVNTLVVDGQPRDVAYEGQRYLLRVSLPRPLAPGATTVVAFDFTATAPLNAGITYYGAFNEQSGVLALASSYPIAAIVRGGEWDTGRSDPRGDFVDSETALYDVTLTAPADWSLATTGVAIDRRQDGDRQTERIVSGPQREFAISATQLKLASADVDGTRINSYFRPEHGQGGQAALQAAANALRVFNKRYGRYPLVELDVIEVTASNFLGVEYPGLIMIEQGLYDGNGLEITVAHEVAHQWWYSQVGNSVLNEAWLDEALASYSQIVYQEEIHGHDAAERELESFRERYRNAIAAGRDAPVEQPTAAFRGNYVSLVYGKAVLFFQAMRKQIGEAAFDRFLHAHYAQHRYDYITGADLLADVEGACGCDLHPLYADWITRAVAVEMP